ncbi:unnamed protein product [Musa acuminata subsp. burmannicoides]
MAASLLGEDGRGYELARRLEGCGAWRAWLGDAAYSAFAHNLASPAAWDAFISPSPSPSRAHLHLQLRVRALLFDKASAALFLRPAPAAGNSAPSLADLNPDYLQLHGDDIYYSLEDDQQDGVQHEIQIKTAFTTSKVNEHSYERSSNSGPKYHEGDNINSFPRHRLEDRLDTWYSQFLREYRMRHHTFPYCDKEPQKRTSEGMSMFLKLCDTHKRKRQTFKGDQNVATGVPMAENGSSVHSKSASNLTNLTDEDYTFFPEIMFPSNCVPDSAIPPSNGTEKNQNIEVREVLDNLPTIISRSPAMIERFGIMPEYHKVGGKYRGKDGSGTEKKPLGPEEASKMTRKVVASTLAKVGFEGGSEFSVEIFSEILSSHICKLGRSLKLLSDSYRRQFSSIELLKMFLQTAGYSNLGILSEVIKDGNKGFTQHAHQNVRVMQSPQQNMILQAQQIQRQLQMQQMQLLHPQNLAFQQQQQWDKLRRRQVATPRGSMVIMDKDQPMVDVKLENMTESPMESMFSTLNKQQQLQLRHQISMSNQHAQSGQQFKQMSNVQLPQLQAQNAYSMRTQPVKVEASFHELMGGDSTIKHEPEHNKLTSPQQ